MFEGTDDGVVWRGDGETLEVRAWGPDSFRVRSRLMGELLDTDYALLPPQPSDVDVKLDTDVAVVRNGRIEAVLRSSRGTVITTRACFGMSRSTFFRLCVRAPRTRKAGAS